MKLYLFAFCCLLVGASLAQKAELRLNLEVGKEYSQSTTSKVSVDQILFGRKACSLVTIAGKTVYHVKAVTGNFYDMDVCYTELGMDMQNGSFSSDNSGEASFDYPFSSILNTMKNKWFKAKMNNKGEISNVEGISVLFDFMDSSVKKKMMDAFGEKALKKNMQVISAVFPGYEVEKGDTWTSQNKVESATPMNVVTTYKLKQTSNQVYIITSKSKIVSANKDLFIAIGEIHSKYDLKGTIISEIKIDKQTGWIIESKMKQEIKGEAFVKLNQQSKDGIVVPMVMRTETFISNK